MEKLVMGGVVWSNGRNYVTELDHLLMGSLKALSVFCKSLHPFVHEDDGRQKGDLLVQSANVAEAGVVINEPSHCKDVRATTYCTADSLRQFVRAAIAVRDSEGFRRLTACHEYTEEERQAPKCLVAGLPDPGVVAVEEEMVGLLLHVLLPPAAVEQVVVAKIGQRGCGVGVREQALELRLRREKVAVVLLGQHLCQAADEAHLLSAREEGPHNLLCLRHVFGALAQEHLHQPSDGITGPHSLVLFDQCKNSRSILLVGQRHLVDQWSVLGGKVCAEPLVLENGICMALQVVESCQQRRENVVVDQVSALVEKLSKSLHLLGERGMWDERSTGPSAGTLGELRTIAVDRLVGRMGLEAVEDTKESRTNLQCHWNERGRVEQKAKVEEAVEARLGAVNLGLCDEVKDVLLPQLYGEPHGPVISAVQPPHNWISFVERSHSETQRASAPLDTVVVCQLESKVDERLDTLRCQLVGLSPAEKEANRLRTE
mmetsp:Transcript_16639/g.64977  ORF Transcript_16639/g.64977 Transcript_16639/m.64977 type:complete len:487 (+) Transcript_16639:456-1916(+)